MSRGLYPSPFFNKKSEGITLIETLIAIAVFSLIAGALFASIVNLYQTNDFVWHQANAVSEARRGVKTMIREIREAQVGEDGSYMIATAGDSEFIFFSDIDQDDEVERIRYYLGGTSASEDTKDCVSYIDGGTCSVVFSDFYTGTLEQAQVQVSIEGDFGWSIEDADVFADGFKLGDLCSDSGQCTDCPGYWQGTAIFDVTAQAQDNYLQFLADASAWVADFCDWQEPNHSMKAQFILSWTDTAADQEQEFKKGVIEPEGTPPQYPEGQEQIIILSRYVRNKVVEPEEYVFRYFDADGQEITQYPARAEETQLMQVSLIINSEPARVPDNYALKSKVQLRNLKLDDD